MQTWLIFDFDGTLANTLELILNHLQELADEFGLRKISSAEVGLLRDFNSTALIKFLKIPIFKLPKVIFRVRSLMNGKMHEIIPIEGIPAVLQQLRSNGFHLGVLTSNSVANVEQWLCANGLIDLFSFVHSESSFFGKSSVIKRLIKKHKMHKSHTYYIGDETRDIEAAQRNRIHAVAVTWGLNSANILSRYQPDYLLIEPKELLRIVR